MKTILKNTVEFVVRMAVGLTVGTVVGAVMAGFLHYGLLMDAGTANVAGSVVSIVVTGLVANS